MYDLTSQLYILLILKSTDYGETDLCGQLLSSHAVPMFREFQ